MAVVPRDIFFLLMGEGSNDLDCFFQNRRNTHSVLDQILEFHLGTKCPYASYYLKSNYEYHVCQVAMSSGVYIVTSGSQESSEKHNKNDNILVDARFYYKF